MAITHISNCIAPPAKGDLDARGIRRMLATTVGRIERLEDAIRRYSETDDGFTTPERRTVVLARCFADLDKQYAKLRHYNAMAQRYRNGTGGR
jgi:hypothetical protein